MKKRRRRVPEVNPPEAVERRRRPGEHLVEIRSIVDNTWKPYAFGDRRQCEHSVARLKRMGAEARIVSPDKEQSCEC